LNNRGSKEVYRDVSSIEITLGPTITNYEFIKISNTSIKQILITGDEIFFTLQ
jgi:hypothetical protein